jgi:hypothetical protein
LCEQLLKIAIGSTGSKTISLFNRDAATSFFLLTKRSPDSFEDTVAFPFSPRQLV